MNRIKKTLISGITILSLFTMTRGDIIPIASAADSFGGGTGTQSDPYIISTAAHLTRLATDVDGGIEYADKYFNMTDDITVSGSWNSIGSSTYSFKGIFDGGNHRIDGLTQSGDNASNRGLFYGNYGTIKNLTVSGDIRLTDVALREAIGGIVSYNYGIIETCSFEGNIIVTAQDGASAVHVGGIAGKTNNDGTIKNCHNSATVKVIQGFSAWIGGIAGWALDGSSIIDCYNTGAVASEDVEYPQIGGIVGHADNCKTSNCYNTGTITALLAQDSNIGQIVGHGDFTGSNNYYLSPTASTLSTGDVQLFDNGITTLDDNTEPIPKTAEQFASGEVTYLLNNSTSSGDLSWYQTLESDSLPTLDSSHEVVYYSEDTGYSNEPTESPPPPAEGRKLYVDFMGTGDTPLDESPSSWEKFKAGDETDNSKKQFWIGVAVDKVNDLDLFKNGVYSLEIAFEYDPDFVQPYYTDNSTNPETDWYNTLIAGNFSTENNSLYWNSDQYTITAVRETDIDITNDRENLSDAVQRENNGWKMCTVLVEFKENETFTSARFSGLDSEDKQYLLKFPFLLKKTPATGENQNPTVLILARGPETLDIGSNDQGIIPCSAWEATVTDPNDATNMKTLFGFGGDIKLFGEDAALSDIIVVKPKTDEETEDTEYELSKSSDTLLKEGFDMLDPDTVDYYVSVPNETDTLKLKIETSEEPTVTANGVTLSSSPDGTYYVTEPFDVLELNKDPTTGGSPDGFNNTVIVDSGGTQYTIHIRRLLKPRIELNPGNSPYGMIERMGEKYYKGTGTPWTEEQIEAVKTKLFDHSNLSDAFNYRFRSKVTLDDGSIVDGVPAGASQDIKYQPIAWSGNEATDKFRYGDTTLTTLNESWFDKNINMDMNENALFIYERREFTDPGIHAVYDEYGDQVNLDDSNITITAVAKDIQRLKVSTMSEVDATASGDCELEVILDSDNNRIVSNLTKIGTKVIRPDVYDLEYTIQVTEGTDTKTLVTASRKMIVLAQRGDFDLNNILNSTDVSTTVSWYQRTDEKLFDGLTPRVANLVYYRIFDVDLNTIINSTDASTIKGWYQQTEDLAPDIYQDVKNFK